MEAVISSSKFMLYLVFHLLE